MLKSNLHFESVNPKNLRSNELRKIAEVEKDLWAYWIGEYVKCNCCQLIHSKNDIFWHLSSEVKIENVTKLEEIFVWDSIRCKRCNNDTEFIYDVDKNVIDIIQRYKEEAFLVIWYDDSWEIKWFMDWYISDFSTIYKMELEHYYTQYWEEYIKNIIEYTIWNVMPKKMLVSSSLWTEERYSNFFVLFNFLKEFFLSLPNISNLVWISELDTWSNLHWVYHSLWAKSLWLLDLWSLNKNVTFNSDIFIQENIIDIYKESFSLNIKQFIRKNRALIQEITLLCRT